MRLSYAGLAAIKRHEGLRLAAYQDVAGVWTIGYGTTYYRNGDKVRPGDAITADEAEALLRDQLEDYADSVRTLVQVPLSQAQFDALVSWTYNLGAGALRDSTMLKRLNAGDYAGAADEMLRWVHAGGRPVAGLRNRREAERAMFLTGVDVPVEKPAPSQPTTASKPMAPVVAALLPSIVSMIPELAKLFGSGSEVSNRNIKAAERVAEVVVQATKAPNLQGAVEQMQADPESRRAASEAVQAEWYALVEAGGGGIDGARKFNLAMTEGNSWRSAWWGAVLSLLALGVVLGGGAVMARLLVSGIDESLAAQILDYFKAAGFIVLGYAFGSSASSRSKDETIAQRAKQ